MLQAFSSLNSANYRLLAFGQTTASLGQQMRVFVRGYLIYEMTGSALYLSAMYALTTAPLFIVPFISGVAADRLNRRMLLIISEALLFALWLIVALLIVGEKITPLHLLVATVPSGVFQGIQRPARMAILADTVQRGHLANAVALNSAIQSSTVLLGPAVGGLVYVTFGVGAAFLLTAVLQGFTLLSAIFLRVDRGERIATRQSMARDFVQGLQYVRTDAVITGLILLGVVSSVFGTGYVAFLPVFSAEVLHSGAEGLSLLLAATGAGTLLGSLFIVFLGNFRRQGIILSITGIANAALLLAFSQSPWLVLSVSIALVMGIVSSAYRTLNQTILQMSAPDELRGRVMGFSTIVHALSPVSFIIMGVLIDRVGVANAMGASAILLAVSTTAVLASSPRLRTFRFQEAADATVSSRSAGADAAPAHARSGPSGSAWESKPPETAD